MGQGHLQICQSKAHMRFLFVANSNICPICHRLQDIDIRNVHYLDLEFYNGPRSNVHLIMETPHATSERKINKMICAVQVKANLRKKLSNHFALWKTEMMLKRQEFKVISHGLVSLVSRI